MQNKNRVSGSSDTCFARADITTRSEMSEERGESDESQVNVKKELNMMKFELNKPKMSGIVVVNLRSGKGRIPRQGEVGVIKIDNSDPSYADGKIVKRGEK